MWQILLFACVSLFAKSATLLTQAEEIAKLYENQIAQEKPPKLHPLTDEALESSSVWLDLNPQDLQIDGYPNPFEWLSKEELWRILKDLNIQAVHLQNIRGKDQLHLTKCAKSYWPSITEMAAKFQIQLIADLIGNSTSLDTDFEQALQNVGEYPSLYHLISIPSDDWHLLPEVPCGACTANIPWLFLQKLHQKGYVPEQFSPLTKQSSWNATVPVAGIDGKVRRWIYLKEGQDDPIFSWLSPSFAAYRLASADALNITKEFGAKILQIDGKIPNFAQEMLSLWIRKIGGYSAGTVSGTLKAIEQAKTDFIYDHTTPLALLHALITEDAESLRAIYMLFLQRNIDTKKFIHSLTPIDHSSCSWNALINSYTRAENAQEMLTESILNRRLLKEDLLQLDSFEGSSWVNYCAKLLETKDFDKHQKIIQDAHLFLVFAYAMQPGVFSLSLADLLGALPETIHHLNPIEPSAKCLYSGLPLQMKIPNSFLSHLKAILQARREMNIKSARLIDVLPCKHLGSLLLLYELYPDKKPYLLALNFSKKYVSECIRHEELSNTTAIDLLLQKTEEKTFSSSQFSFILPPLCGKAFYFQSKYQHE